MKTSHSSGMKKAVKITLIIIGSLIALQLILSVIIPFVQSYIIQNQLTSDVTRQREIAISQTKDTYGQYVTRLQRTSGLSKPVYTETRDTCYTDHDDSGWFAKNYNYKCLLVYTAIFELTDAQAKEIRTAGRISVQGPQTIEPIFYEDYLLSKASRGGITTVRFAIASTGFYTDTLISQLADKSFLAYPSVIAYASLEAAKNSYSLESASNQPVDPSRDYLISVWSEQYYQKDIGCRVPEVIFCSKPISDGYTVK